MIDEAICLRHHEYCTRVRLAQLDSWIVCTMARSLNSTFYKTLISEEIEESQIVSKSVLITKRPSNYGTPSEVMDFS